MRLFWYLIPQDGPYPWRADGQRKIDYSYLRQLSTTIDHLGYEGALVAGGGGGHELWTLSAFMAANTTRMKFVVAQHPGRTSPMFMAQQAATFDELSGGRLIINIVNGDDNSGHPHGIFHAHDERYAMAEEYWSLWTRLVAGEEVSFEGKYFRLKNARVTVRPHQQPRPELFFGGSSTAAMEMAARHIDTYLTYGEAPPYAGEKIAKVRALAKQAGRRVDFGIRLHLIVRETREEAWRAAQKAFDHIDQKTIESVRRVTSGAGSVGQERMNALTRGPLSENVRDLEFYPDLWSGIGLTRTGNAVAVVGDPETVAERLREYHSYGINTFILSGYPLIEEAYRFHDLVVPLLQERRAHRSNTEAHRAH
jgi:alkanesulfonate monooxygenase